MAAGNGPDSGTLVEIYRRMLLIKVNDERVRAAAKAGRMNLIYYSPRGQEVIPSALSVHLTDRDYVCTIYRGIHDQLAKGVPSRTIWAEYAGRTTGSCKGKGGPMHITHPDSGVMVTTGVVGSSMPIANGLALASQIRGEDRVTIANFGDGASNIGAFHESLNLAAIWRLPVIFVCQNNRYAEHSAFGKFTGGGSVARRGDALGIPGIEVDGNDPVAMWRVAGEAVSRARSGDGPTLIEAHTFRFHGHLLGDDASYIPKAELAAAVAGDPVPRLRATLVEDGHASEDSLVALERAILREVSDAEAFALASPWPEKAELARDVLAPAVGDNPAHVRTCGTHAATAKMNAVQALNMALHDAMTEDANVIVFGEDLADPEGGGVLGVTKGLSTTFGDSRVRSTPISEQAIIGAGVGAALAGMRPVTEIMLMNFTTVAMDMITNHAAKLRFMSGGQTHVPMVIRTMTGAGVGNGGQHSDYLEAWFAHTPGIKVVTYSSPADAYGLLLSAIFDEDPVLFIENLATYFVAGPAPERGKPIPLGRAAISREGTDVSIISYGYMVNHALAAADSLAREGVSVEVVDLRTIAPYDSETVLASVGKTGRAVIVHEAVRNFGVGAEIAAEIAEAMHGKLHAPVRRVGSSFNAVPFSRSLEAAHMPDADAIAAAVRTTLG